MAYSNWGAFVYCNGNRREDKEDVVLFEGTPVKTWGDCCHGVMGDGNIRVRCYKNYAPKIFEKDSDGTIHKISFLDKDADVLKFDVRFEYKGYKFHFKSGGICKATMTEPDGTNWECTYGYCYGAGWTD